MFAISNNLENIKSYSSNYNERDIEAFIKQNNSFGKKIATLFFMLKDKNFKISDSTKLIFMGAIGYVILPLDLVPDFIPLAGLIDDAAVLSAVWNAASNDIKRFIGGKN